MLLLLEDEATASVVVKARPSDFEYVPERLRADRNFALVAVKADPANLEHVSEPLRADRNFLMSVLPLDQTVDAYRHSLKYTPAHMRDDRDVIVSALQGSMAPLLGGSSYKLVSPRLLKDVDIWVEGIRLNSRHGEFGRDKTIKIDTEAQRMMGLAVARCDFLQHAVFGGSTMTDFFLESLAQWISNSSNLKSLDIQNHEITDKPQAMTLLAALNTNKTLQTFILHPYCTYNEFEEDLHGFNEFGLRGYTYTRFCTSGYSFKFTRVAEVPDGPGSLVLGEEPFSIDVGGAYTGMIVNNRMHGQGVRTWASGRRHEGEFLRGLRHGFGTSTSADGKVVISGQWANDWPLHAFPVQCVVTSSDGLPVRDSPDGATIGNIKHGDKVIVDLSQGKLVRDMYRVPLCGGLGWITIMYMCGGTSRYVEPIDIAQAGA